MSQQSPRRVSLGPSCLTCKHLRSFVARQCAAFPEVLSIPESIMNDAVDHTMPYPGDGGIQYEPDELEVRRWERGRKP